MFLPSGTVEAAAALGQTLKHACKESKRGSHTNRSKRGGCRSHPQSSNQENENEKFYSRAVHRPALSDSTVRAPTCGFGTCSRSRLLKYLSGSCLGAALLPWEQ